MHERTMPTGLRGRKIGVARVQFNEHKSQMQFAIVGDRRRAASRHLHGKCPSCGGGVVAKCGSIVAWHWAHESADCDPWNEPESDWHVEWKRKFPDDWQEVVIGSHRADVKTPKLVVEFQASSISAEEIQQREQHYGNMVWLLRGEDFRKNLRFRKRDGFYTFRWMWPRKSWFAARMPIVIALGGEEPLFHVKKLHDGVPCGGWGCEMTEVEFLRRCGLGSPVDIGSANGIVQPVRGTEVPQA
jgi:hypothetical protein